MSDESIAAPGADASELWNAMVEMHKEAAAQPDPHFDYLNADLRDLITAGFLTRPESIAAAELFAAKWGTPQGEDIYRLLMTEDRPTWQNP